MIFDVHFYLLSLPEEVPSCEAIMEGLVLSCWAPCEIGGATAEIRDECSLVLSSRDQGVSKILTFILDHVPGKIRTSTSSERM
jgi:hypothetical protein